MARTDLAPQTLKHGYRGPFSANALDITLTAAGKYQYWVNDQPCDTLDSFIEGATEHKGSWWPDWIEWLRKQAPKTVKVTGARVPGGGKLKAIEDAPGRYVKER